MAASPSNVCSIEDDDFIDDSQDGEEGNQEDRKMNAWELINSTYKNLGTPPEVGDRFLRFLLNNENYDQSGLLRIIQLDHERINRHANIMNRSGNNGNNRINDVNKQIMKMREDVSLQINAWELIQYDYELGDMLLRFPTTLLPLLEEAAIEALKIILRKTLGYIYNSSQDYHAKYNCYPPIMKRVNTLLNNMHQQPLRGDPHQPQQRQWKIHARIINLPPTHTCCKPSISSIQAHDIGKIVQLSGTVVRVSPVQMLEVSRAYQCNKCKHTFCIYADFQQCNNALPHPTNCPTSPACNSATFEPLPYQAIHTDYQEIKLQESGNALAPIPRSIVCKLQHDLVDSCQPGDDVFVVGSLMAQWQSVVANLDCTITMALHVHSIKVMNGNTDDNSSTWDRSLSSLSSSQISGTGKMRDRFRREFDEFWSDHINRYERPIAARNFICKAVCPKLYGMMTVKIGLLLTLIGGSSFVDDVPLSRENFNHTNSMSANDDHSKTRDDAIHKNNRGTQSSDLQNKSGNDNDDCIDSDSDASLPEAFYIDPPTEQDKSSSKHTIHHATNSNSTNNSMTETTINNPSTPTANINHNNIHNHTATTTNSNIYDGKRIQRQTIINSNNDTSIQTKRRTESHILLVGDPGTGKSQFLRFAAALSPRSVLTTGIGTTSAGLTCAAVRDGNNGSKQYTLEAGALVLADRGVCCIDEFGCIREEDRAAIHEAMEQQTISVAKAGIVCKLNSRATVVAVMNPKGAIYAPHLTLTKNTNISSPLLSRFDLIFVLLDGAAVNEEAQDKSISTFLLNHAIQGEEEKLEEKLASHDECSETDPIYSSTTTTIYHTKNPVSNIDGNYWSMDKLRAYIATVKERFHPKLSAEAAHLLQAHYQRCRNSHQTSVQITVRFLESLIRLSQAHARLMYRNVVEREDAAAVILIMECSAATSAGLSRELVDKDDLFDPPMNFELVPDERVDDDFRLKMQKVLLRYSGGTHNDIDSNGDHNDIDNNGWDEGQNINGNLFPGNNSIHRSTHSQTHGSQKTDNYGRQHYFSPKQQSDRCHSNDRRVYDETASHDKTSQKKRKCMK